MVQSVQQAIQQIKKGEIAPIYLLVGTDQYLTQLFKDELIKAVLPNEEDQFNLVNFSLDEQPLSNALAEAISFPFFGDKKVIWVNESLFLTSDKKAALEDSSAQELLDYLAQPVDTSVIVFSLNKEKADERKKIVKQLKKQAEVISTAPLNEKEMRTYIQQYLSETPYRFQPEAFERFLQLTDMDLSKVISELKKLTLYAGDQHTIRLDTVENLVPKTLDHNIFDMVQYVTQNKTEQAIRLYRDLVLQGEETIKINAILITHFRLLLQTKIFSQRGYPQKAIAEALNIHPYRIKLALEQVRRTSLENIGRLFDELVENDFRLKTGAMEPQLMFELFLLKPKQL